jgi:hypothetical protein
MKRITLTEAANEIQGIYVERGWLTLGQARQINRDSFIIAGAIILVVIALPAAFVLFVSLCCG